MKLNDIRPSIESSGELQEQFFSIKDQGMIFDILRNKMYSNPILAICREISCNARDAHREVKTPDVQVQITLPSPLEPFYKVRDFGPGISPDRMSNIFIQYTASTKRDDNVQTGGFGLGAKTPFSYSDTFTIKTVFDGTEYNYACFIDETKVGKLALLNQVPTKEANGTEIIIPVRPVDFRLFNEWTEFSTRHWTVRPLIKGGIINWKESTPIISGTDWAIMSTSDYNRNVKLIIDGIEYPVDLAALRTYADAKLIDASRGNLFLYFNVGELSLSASREAVYLDKPTEKKIAAKLESACKEIKKNVTDKIQAFANLWEANVYYRKDLHGSFNSIDFLGPLKWNNITLTNNYCNLGCTVFNFQKGSYSRRKGNDPDKIKRATTQSLSFVENSAIYINDLPLREPTPKHVKKAFENDPKLTSVQVVIPSDKISIEHLNKEFHLDKMNPINLSAITQASSRNYTPATSRLLVFKFDSNSSAFRQVSYSSIDEDSNKKILCRITRDQSMSNRMPILKSKKLIDLSNFRDLQKKFPTYSFYGVDTDTDSKRIEEDLADFESLDDFLNENIIKNKTINYVEIKFALSQSYRVDGRLLDSAKKLKPLLANKDSLYLKKVELHHKMKNIIDSDNGLLKIYEVITGDISTKDLELFEKSNSDYNLQKFDKDIAKRYPLLTSISTYNFNELAPAIAQYVNLIDKEIESLSSKV